MVDDGNEPNGISVTTNGPYLVSGGLPITRCRPVVSEHGEPMTWQTLAAIEAPETVRLRRCGQSSNKPFCDGTHALVGFDGTETAPESSYDDRQTTYATTEMVMRDDRSICEHAGFCSNRVTSVWKMVKNGDTDDSVARAQLMAMVERCPWGALTFRLAEEGADVEPGLRAGIGVVDGGPLFVTGGVPGRRADGRYLETRNRMTLCRCGGSGNKPLCDGSHQKNGFADS